MPVIGDVSVSDVTLQDVLQVLRPIWETKTETASKVRQRMERVLDYSTVSGHRTGENPTRWRGNLDMVPAAPSRLTGGRNYPALRLDDATRWFAALQARDGISARAIALRFASLEPMIAKLPADGSTIGMRIHTFRSDEEKGPCNASGGCEVLNSSPPSMPPSTTTSTRNDPSPTETNSSRPVPPLSRSGANLARHKGQRHCPSGDWFAFV